MKDDPEVWALFKEDREKVTLKLVLRRFVHWIKKLGELLAYEAIAFVLVILFMILFFTLR